MMRPQEIELDERGTVSNWLLLLGCVLLLIGAWLLINPTQEGEAVNLHKLFLGQTSAFVGTMMLATGILLKFLK